jgi:hypothetical protein
MTLITYKERRKTYSNSFISYWDLFMSFKLNSEIKFLLLLISSFLSMILTWKSLMHILIQIFLMLNLNACMIVWFHFMQIVVNIKSSFLHIGIVGIYSNMNPICYVLIKFYLNSVEIVLIKRPKDYIKLTNVKMHQLPK